MSPPPTAPPPPRFQLFWRIILNITLNECKHRGWYLENTSSPDTERMVKMDGTLEVLRNFFQPPKVFVFFIFILLWFSAASQQLPSWVNTLLCQLQSSVMEPAETRLTRRCPPLLRSTPVGSTQEKHFSNHPVYSLNFNCHEKREKNVQ